MRPSVPLPGKSRNPCLTRRPSGVRVTRRGDSPGRNKPKTGRSDVKTKTNVKAGSIRTDRCETVKPRSKTLCVRSGVKAGSLWHNRCETLKVKTGVKGGMGLPANRCETLKKAKALRVKTSLRGGENDLGQLREPRVGTESGVGAGVAASPRSVPQEQPPAAMISVITLAGGSEVWKMIEVGQGEFSLLAGF